MTKTIELSKVRQGERFTLDGVEFVKLDENHMGAFIVAADALPDNCQFESDDAEREDHNNFSGSHIAKVMERWLRDQHKPIFDATLEHPIDLTTMDGMTDYGTPLAVARLLTIDEYREYRRFIPLASRPFWLATGWTTNSSPYSDADYAYRIYTDGTVYCGYVYRAYFAPRPALYLKSSILVSIESDDEGCKDITTYTDTELMDELYRRRRANYDAG